MICMRALVLSCGPHIMIHLALAVDSEKSGEDRTKMDAS
jgi:hypothetical protein